MRLLGSLSGLCLLIAAGSSAYAQHGTTYATPEEAAADPDFAVQGEYLRCGGETGYQVIALGEGRFQAVVYPGGLPGYGWDGETKDKVEGDTAAMQELLAGCTRIERRSPTLGATPPAEAVVLFDGTQESLEAHWREGAEMTEDGLLKQGVTSKDEFGSFYVHLEFRLPYMPEARGQGRGNSGYYVQGRYEIQMLDSFGLEGENNECGGIYSVSRPDVNMAFPPLSWQTYDVEFTDATFDDDGNRTADAHAKVWHNGVLIHDRDIPQITPSGTLGDITSAPGPVFLQNHGNPVRYRNIWVLPR